MYYQRSKNKYGAKKKEYGGRIYMSKGEAGYALELDLRKRAGEIREIFSQYKLSLDVNGYHICNYYVDFMCVMSDGSRELHEYKGFVTAIWQLKWKLTEALFSDKYKMVVIK